VSFIDGSQRRYDLVIGADGLYSDMLVTLLDDPPKPHFTGQGVWHAVLSRPAHIVRHMLWIGKLIEVGPQPVSEQQMHLIVSEDCSLKQQGAQELLLSRLPLEALPFDGQEFKAPR